MAGHLLQTVNPAADTVDPSDVPPAGLRVQYHCRPGMGVGGKTLFGAEVLHCDPRTGLTSLLIIYGPEDYREMINQRRRSDQNPFGWDYMPVPGLEEVRAGLVELRTILLGDYAPPKRSVVDILADFEKRLAAIAPKAKATK